MKIGESGSPTRLTVPPGQKMAAVGLNPPDRQTFEYHLFRCYGGSFPGKGQNDLDFAMVLTRQGRQIGSSVFPFLPLFLRAPVVHGKRRGGKELGIPTGKTHGVYKQFTRPVEIGGTVRGLWVSFDVAIFHNLKLPFLLRF